MPELAEVEFYRKRWHESALHQQITAVHTHDGKKIFRSAPARRIKQALTGSTLLGSEAAAK